MYYIFLILGCKGLKAHRRAVVVQALQALGVVEGQLVREELALAAEQARLDEADRKSVV